MIAMNRYVGTVARMGGVPVVFEEFLDSFADLVQWNARYLCEPGEQVYYPRPPRVSIHDVARNLIVEGMRGGWLLMLDTDHSFEPDVAARLLNLLDRTGADVATALYQYRAAPHSPVLFRHVRGGLHPLGDWDARVTALEVDSAGAGCLMVRRSVFARIEAELHERPFARIDGYGEDHSFFLRLKRMGIAAVCDPRIECHHLQVRPLSLADYDRSAVDLEDPEPAKGYR